MLLPDAISVSFSQSPATNTTTLLTSSCYWPYTVLYIWVLMHYCRCFMKQMQICTIQSHIHIRLTQYSGKMSICIA